MNISKKLTLALKLKDWDKLSDGDRMTYVHELDNCSPFWMDMMIIKQKRIIIYFFKW